jgi:hypothetical protein
MDDDEKQGLLDSLKEALFGEEEEDEDEEDEYDE